MKRILCASILFLLSFPQLYAQTDPARVEQDHIFQHINKSLIPSGYLDGYGPQLLDKNWLNGVLTNSNRVNDITLLRYLYNDIENAKLYTNALAMATLETVNTAIAQSNTASATPLVFLTGQYSMLRQDALQQNLFTYSNNQIFDVPGRSQRPYLLQNVFPVAPVKQLAPQTNELSLTYNPSFIYANNGKIISQVWIDFLDGQGYQSLAANRFVSKTYTDISGYKQLAMKMQYTDNSIHQCKTV